MSGSIHVVAAVTALLVGAGVLCRPKGTRLHVRLGRVYGVAMVVLNMAALMTLEQSGGVGAFHVFAVVSLVTLLAGWTQMALRASKPRPRVVRHAYFMAWSFVGLTAAGTAQMANLAWPAWQPWPVIVGSTSIVSCGGWIAHRLLPRVLDKSAPVA